MRLLRAIVVPLGVVVACLGLATVLLATIDRYVEHLHFSADDL